MRERKRMNETGPERGWIKNTQDREDKGEPARITPQHIYVEEETRRDGRRNMDEETEGRTDLFRRRQRLHGGPIGGNDSRISFVLP